MRLWLPLIDGAPALLERPTDSAKPPNIITNQIMVDALTRAGEDNKARLAQIHTLTRLLRDSENDRAARLEQIHTLASQLKESELKSAAQLEQVQQLHVIVKELQRGRPLDIKG